MSDTELRIFQGGLMRCCIQSLYEEHDAHILNTFNGKGEETKCKWCGNGMRKNAQGVWEWEGAKSLAHYKDDGK